ncbi:hypothetical protein [Methylobacterium nigriterrae]|uniref:hypothetical protein n=1 Tax=Methylobacterium nigriterrae TaxID=3127512 RepID=UPI003013B228
MTSIASITQVGILRASALQQSVRNDLARRHDDETRTVTVETARPVDPATRIRAGSDVLRSVPLTERRLIDIKV